MTDVKTKDTEIYRYSYEQPNIGKHWSVKGIDYGMEKHTITWTLVEFLEDGPYKGHKSVYRRHTRNGVSIHSDCFSANDSYIRQKAKDLGIVLN